MLFWLIHTLLLPYLAKHRDTNFGTAKENLMSRPDKSKERQVAAGSQSNDLKPLWSEADKGLKIRNSENRSGTIQGNQTSRKVKFYLCQLGFPPPEEKMWF